MKSQIAEAIKLRKNNEPEQAMNLLKRLLQFERFVDFRTANGLELEEDARFRKSKDISVYEIGDDLEAPW